MGAHVSITPNHQLNRMTPLKTRGDVACFGAFGYELDLAQLSESEMEEVRQQIVFVKKYRKLLHSGTFYRLLSPFDGNITAWMVVSEDKKHAVAAYFKVLNDINCEFRRIRLQGLDASMCYRAVDEAGRSESFYGAELMQIGLIATDSSAGQAIGDESLCTDFWSKIILLDADEA